MDIQIVSVVFNCIEIFSFIITEGAVWMQGTAWIYWA